jgi:hypothetical protein
MTKRSTWTSTASHAFIEVLNALPADQLADLILLQVIIHELTCRLSGAEIKKNFGLPHAEPPL